MKKKDQDHDDEMMARNLASQYSEPGYNNDERLAQDLQDELYARELQRRERESAQQKYMFEYPERRSGPFTWPPDDDNDTDDETEQTTPIMTTLEKKVSEIKEGVKSKFSSFTSTISQVLSNPPAPKKEPAYAPLIDRPDEDRDLISSSDDEDLLIDKRTTTQKKPSTVELTINTE